MPGHSHAKKTKYATEVLSHEQSQDNSPEKPVVLSAIFYNNRTKARAHGSNSIQASLFAAHQKQITNLYPHASPHTSDTNASGERSDLNSEPKT